MERTINTIYYYANNGTGCSHKKHIERQSGHGNTIGLCGYDHEYAEIITFKSIPNDSEICKKCLAIYNLI